MERLPEANYWSVIYTEARNILHVDQSEWNKQKVDNLWKTESFVKESMRFVGDACFEMRRKVMTPSGINLSDGTHLPFGTTVGLPSNAIHNDDQFYPEAKLFDGLRFLKLRESHDMNTARGSLLTATSNTFLQFGHGKHGW
ncbi:cytochrome P450 [Penicillium nucicola]|uniref:cytochrome P450 n=1 Tax=Penicillium nucicola TaxID=1850975 RepID=UPI0025451404|nr:cytochrome P450 [Penicillium nucicola]KAJ5775783.1 cytochrome P450 [Penicillium nucicola]